MKKIPLRILIFDKDKQTLKMLMSCLDTFSDSVPFYQELTDLNPADDLIIRNKINAIFIDPLSDNIEITSGFIFKIRKTFPNIVFVLYTNSILVENSRNEFYKGIRSKFIHYYKFDKLTTASAFTEEIEVVLKRCQDYLQKRGYFAEEFNKIESDLDGIIKITNESAKKELLENKLNEVRKDINIIQAISSGDKKDFIPKSVFLSYRFAEEEYINGLMQLLERYGFKIVTGKDSNSFISATVIERIKSCEYFLSLMTKTDKKEDGTYTTSAWLLEEKGVALALNKKIVLMIENEVSDYGGLQGDWQRIHFSSKGFLTAAIKATDQLNSYAGG